MSEHGTDTVLAALLSSVDKAKAAFNAALDELDTYQRQQAELAQRLQLSNPSAIASVRNWLAANPGKTEHAPSGVVHKQIAGD